MAISVHLPFGGIDGNKPSGLCAAIAYFAISSGGEKSIAEVAIASGAGILVGIWLWLTWFTARLFVYRKSPLLIVENDGVEIPHARPPFIAWDQIALVDQIKSGRVTYLRLQLVSPDEQLSRWQRLIKWPYGDSTLVALGANRSATPAPALLAVQARHAAHSNDRRDGSKETAMTNRRLEFSARCG